MRLERLLDTVRAFDGVLELAPTEGSGYPEIAWGDHFFYYAPDGRVPERTQPYATVVTKDYPDDTASDLDPPDRWRVNVHVGTARATEVTDVTELAAETDVIGPHPLYGAAGWIAVVNPAERTSPTVVSLLREAHENARRRADRRP